jgi:hypothetical protein
VQGYNCVIITDYFHQCIPINDTSCFPQQKSRIFNNKLSPTTIDWRVLNGVSPVKDQGSKSSW